MTINIITLGCSKNTVDSEKLLKQLELNGFEVLHNSADSSDVVIINTCGFILDAKTESIETILGYCDRKELGLIRLVYVMGCLSERYKDSLKEEIPQVDAFFGVDDMSELIRSLGGRYHAAFMNSRVQTTPSHYAYLKISEGCNRNCAFCAIPSIRGKQKSAPVEEMLSEASNLAKNGVKELIFIAQDLSSYGTDLYQEKRLVPLVEAVSEIKGIEWIRLHYLYPEGLQIKEIGTLLNTNPNICKYLDIPFQHISDKVLRKMHRGHGRKEIIEIIDYLRKTVPGISLRTTLLTGFPGETDKEFNELYSFVKEMRFERLGVFPYSHEDNTPADEYFRDIIPEKEKIQRMEEIMRLQESISLEMNVQKIGKDFRVIIDGQEGEFYNGRTEHDSPGIDQEVLIPIGNKKLEHGEFYTVRIKDALEFDLFGDTV